MNLPRSGRIPLALEVGLREDQPVPGNGEWTADGRFFDVTIFSDVDSRDGLGWELVDLAPAPGRGRVFEVFREDSGEVPTITSTSFVPVAISLVDRFANAAVADLLGGILREDRTNWLATNVAALLALSGHLVDQWSGPEERTDGSADEYATEKAVAVPFAWLALTLDVGEAEIASYQDDAYFGLRLAPSPQRRISAYDSGYFRIHGRLDLPTGVIESVTLVLDTTVMGGEGSDAVIAEMMLRVDGQPVALIAAESYGPGEWHRLDESVVVLRDLAASDRIRWIPARPRVPEPYWANDGD